jgi:hypothetical protein
MRMKGRNMKIETCTFIPLTQLVPKKWNDWFYGEVSQDAPFSWGDNNRTLITASRLADHVQDKVLYHHRHTKENNAIRKWIVGVRALDSIFIDLEN